MGITFDHDFGDAPIVDGIVYLDGINQVGYTFSAGNHTQKGEPEHVIYCHHCDHKVTFSARGSVRLERSGESDDFSALVWSEVVCSYCDKAILEGHGDLDTLDRTFG